MYIFPKVDFSSTLKQMYDVLQRSEYAVVLKGEMIIVQYSLRPLLIVGI